MFGSKQSSSVREIVMKDLTEEELSDIGIRKNISIPDVQLKGKNERRIRRSLILSLYGFRN